MTITPEPPELPEEPPAGGLTPPPPPPVPPAQGDPYAPAPGTDPEPVSPAPGPPAAQYSAPPPPPPPPAPVATGYGMSTPGAAAASRTSQKATASLVCGIVGFVCFGFILGVVAIILGVYARRDIEGSAGRLGGGGLATAGIVLGVIDIVAWLGWILFLRGH